MKDLPWKPQNLDWLASTFPASVWEAWHGVNKTPDLTPMNKWTTPFQKDQLFRYGWTLYRSTSAATQGKTEEYIGTWFEKTGKRKDIVLATKVAGMGLPWVEKDLPSPENQSVKQLKVHKIKNRLYWSVSITWPNRPFHILGKTMLAKLISQRKKHRDRR